MADAGVSPSAEAITHVGGEPADQAVTQKPTLTDTGVQLAPPREFGAVQQRMPDCVAVLLGAVWALQ